MNLSRPRCALAGLGLDRQYQEFGRELSICFCIKGRAFDSLNKVSDEMHRHLLSVD